ncbi:MAG: L,D-transpeptidase family protein [Myxococcales bacterium]|nr:L,D-transpeptidase family protein [Myxococcales bacterium]
MTRTACLMIAALLVLGCRADAKSTTTFRRNSSWRAPDVSGRARDRGAHERRKATVKAMFKRAGVAFPPAEMMLRVFKREARLEVWASSRRGARMSRVTTYEICSQGSGLGPKLREGDGKTPEGFYKLDLYNRNSSYHLAMRISYPNRLDRQRGRTGSAIMIHGKCVSIGCLAMTDARIEELWVMARAARRRRAVAVHIYPARDMASLIAAESAGKRRAFWQDLAAVKGAFDRSQVMPSVKVRGKRYRLASVRHAARR